MTVGGNGQIVVWQARHEITRVFTLHQFAELSSVESNPKEPAQALVAAEKDIVLISLKGNITDDVYSLCIKVF